MTNECPKCQTNNPEDSKFCKECATPLSEVDEVVHTKTLETPTEELTRGSVFAGRYEIIEELGKGGMGRVYRVEDTKVKEEVALKLIKPEIATDRKTIERFRNELKIARKIRHKNVCAMFDLGEERGKHYITMEYVPGEDLKSLIRRVGRLDSGTAVKIAIQVCEGLAEAHRLGVIHRDLKPNNIMIDKEGNARIMDFGIARSLEAEGATEAGKIIGTPNYISPEQVEGEQAERVSDIYSLGVVVYEMVTGRVPFEGETAVNVMFKHKSEKPPDPKELNPQISENLKGLILRCLEKDKSRRYQGAKELSSELVRIEKGIPAAEKILLEKEPQVARLGLKKTYVLPLALIFVVIVGLIVWQVFLKKKSLPVLSEKPSVVVLPFTDLSPQKDQEIFCDGMADTLINALTNITDLRVIARNSAFSFKGKEQDGREIARKLNAETVLEGSVQKAGNRLRITAKLVHVEEGYHLWSEQYNREMDDVFSIQDEISMAIVENLKIKLAGEEKSLLVKRYTENLEAYNLYQKGRYFWSKSTMESLWKGIEYFRQAIEKDPVYALAYAGIADSYILLGIFYTAPKETYTRAKAAAEKALEMDESLVEARASLGIVTLLYDWDWPTAEKELKRAIQLGPKNVTAHLWYSVYLTVMGRFEDSMKEAELARELDPISPLTTWFSRTMFYYARQNDRAIEVGRKALEIDPNNFMSHLLISMAHFEKGENTEAFTMLQKGMDLSRSGDQPQIMRQVFSYILSGKTNELNKVFDAISSGSSQEYLSPYLIATIYLKFDQKDQAFEWLERAYEVRDTWLIALKVDPRLDSVRSDPKFLALVKKIGLAGR